MKVYLIIICGWHMYMGGDAPQRMPITVTEINSIEMCKAIGQHIVNMTKDSANPAITSCVGPG